MTKTQTIDPSVKARIEAMTESALKEIDKSPDWHLPKLPPHFILSPARFKSGCTAPEFRDSFREGRFRMGKAQRGEPLP